MPERIPDPAASRWSSAAGSCPGTRASCRAACRCPGSQSARAGARNGVLTAIEDFVAGREGVRLATLPIFFGFGVGLGTSARPGARRLPTAVAPWDRNPILERLEGNRVYHLAFGHRMFSERMAFEGEAASSGR